MRQCAENNQVMIVTHEGKCIKFDQSDVRPMGRAMGVRGIKLKTGDYVVEMDVIKNADEASLLVIMENGLGKRTPVSEYRFQTRGGSGVKTANLTEKTGKLVGAKVLEPETEGDVMVMSKKGVMIRTPLSSVPKRGRATQGVYIMRTKKGDVVQSMSLIIKDKEDNTAAQKEAEDKQTTLV